MKAAAKSVKITPEIGFPLGGNIREDNASRGVHDDLFCNIIILEEKNERIVFLGFDLLALQYDSCQQIKKEISKASGIDASHIIISVTHTHSGPDVVEIFKPEMLKEAVEFINKTSQSLAKEVKELLPELKAANIKIAKGLVNDLSFNRRLVMKDGSLKMNWEDINIADFVKETGPIDPELYAIEISDLNDKIIAVMVNFTLHPAVLVGKDWLISRDYINYLDNYVKSQLGDDITIFFANGAEGNVNHINFRDKNQGRGFEEAERIGVSLGKKVIDILKSAESIENTELKILSRNIALPLREITEDAVKKAEKLLAETGDNIPSLLDGVPDEIYAREILKLSKAKEKNATTELQAVSIGNTAIATLPGEVFVEFGLRIKENSEFKNTLVFGLTNDFIGYIPTEVSFKEGGYEIKTACSSKLAPNAGDILADEVIKLLKDL